MFLICTEKREVLIACKLLSIHLFTYRYEDGTASFLSIIALKHGFSTLKSLTGSMRAITKHTFALAQFTYKEMKSFKHANGFSLCEIYSDTKFDDMTTQGPVVNFNLINCHGEYIGYSQVTTARLIVVC